MDAKGTRTDAGALGLCSQVIFINLSIKLSSNLEGHVPHTAVRVGVKVFGHGCSLDQIYVE